MFFCPGPRRVRWVLHSAEGATSLNGEAGAAGVVCVGALSEFILAAGARCVIIAHTTVEEHGVLQCTPPVSPRLLPLRYA